MTEFNVGDRVKWTPYEKLAVHNGLSYTGTIVRGLTKNTHDDRGDYYGILVDDEFNQDGSFTGLMKELGLDLGPETAFASELEAMNA